MSTEFPLIRDLVAIESSAKLELCILPEEMGELDCSISVLQDLTANDVKQLIAKFQYILDIEILMS